MSELHDLLDRSTDRIDPSDGRGRASAALSRARVVRRRRRGVAAAGVAAALVVGVAVVSGLAGSDRADPPIAPSPDIPAIPTSVVQPVFDPRTADELPQRDTGLPTTMVPPEDVPELPLSEPAALVLRGRGAVIYLLTADGQWASTRTPTGDAYGATLNRDGTMLASFEEGALHVIDLRDGQWRAIALPRDWPTGSLSTRIHWLSDDEVVLWGIGSGMAWAVPLDASAAPSEHQLSTVRSSGYTVAPDGLEIDLGLHGTTAEPVLDEARDGELVRRFGAESLNRLVELLSDEDQLVAVHPVEPGQPASSGQNGLVVLDRRNGYTPTHFLPMDWKRQATPVGWLDDSTVLLEWSNAWNNWVLVAWQVDSGELTRVATGGDEAQLGP